MATVYLAHHGIKGQKWGVRRFQNPDGTLTALGKERYYTDKDSKRLLRGARTAAYYGNYWYTNPDIEEACDFLVKQKKVIHDERQKLQDIHSDILNEINANSKIKNSIISELADKAKNNGEEGVFIDDIIDALNPLLADKSSPLRNCKDFNKCIEYGVTVSNSLKQYRDNCQDIVNDLVGKYGDQKLTKNSAELKYYVQSNIVSKVDKEVGLAPYTSSWNNELYDDIVKQLKGKYGLYIYD